VCVRVCVRADNEIYGNSRRHAAFAATLEEYATNLLYLTWQKEYKKK